MFGVDGPPPLPPSPVPPDQLARCRAAFASNRVRTLRAELEVHRTHLRIETPAVRAVSAFARRMDVDDLVLSTDRIELLRPVGALTVIVELPYGAAIALAGPSVRSVLGLLGDAIPVAPHSFRPFFVGFWLITNRNSRIVDARPLP